MNNLLQKIYDKAPSYGSIPFWSWNDKLEEGELRRQIRRMKELGMNGFFMHARGGLETEYLSDDWFHCVNVCVDEAKKLGMEAWSYDENGWPSGFAGGKLLDDKKNFALGMLTEIVAEFPEDEDTIAAYTKNEDGSYNWVTAPVDGCSEYLRIYRQYDNSYVDVLDGEITKEFLRLTHDEYKKACGEDFGGAMPGFFTDEPQYFRWGHTYSNTLPKIFKETY
ncbi:MAG: glycoside hydrolase, partial [Clostridia bacterium]|nr:glycoside hydrolase [Clostridia bacterium]